MPNPPKENLLRKHSSDLLIRQNNILNGVLLALEILRFVLGVGGEEEFCSIEKDRLEG